MFEVNSKPVLSLLSKKTSRQNLFRNIMAICAIILTTVMFSAVFTISGALVDQNQQAELKYRGSSAHARVSFLSEGEYRKLEETRSYASIAYWSYVGTLAQEETKKINTEVVYGEAEAARNHFSHPTVGRMPEAEDEIAMDTFVLEALGIEPEIGAIVPLTLSVNEHPYENEFVLSGYWEGDKALRLSWIWISEELGERLAPKQQNPFSGNYMEGGYLYAEIFFQNAKNIDEKIEDLIVAAGLVQSAGITYNDNPAYETHFSIKDIDIETVVSIGILLGLILLSGYLIIYNIFYISVTRDIHYYGLLKTIGTSGKQLKRLVYRQAFGLSAVGIPVGLVLGWLIGRVLMPVIMNMVSIADSGNYQSSPVMFILAGLFALFTVFVSCLKPCRLAAGISPVEAVRYTEVKTNSKKEQRRTGACTPASMAAANLSKNKKKAVLVVLSLFLSLTLLNATFTAVKGFNLDEYIERYAMADFYITHYTIPDVSSVDKILNGIDHELIEELQEAEGIESMQYIYAQDQEMLPIADKEKSRLAEIDDDGLQYYLEGSMLPLTLYGVSDGILELIQTEGGELDYEKWQSGEYVIVGTMKRMYEDDFQLYNTGDTVTLTDQNGNLREFTVMDIGNIDHAASVQYTSLYGVECILPESVYQDMYEEQPMGMLFDTEEDSQEEIEKQVHDYCQNRNDDLTYVSRATYEEEFEQDVRMFLIIGGSLSMILGLIGILNFMTAIATSIYARQKELAMLQAIGMGVRQIKQMLIYESLYYIGIAVILTATLGTAVGYFLGTSFFSIFWAFTYRFTFVPVLICIPVLAGLAVGVPLVYYRKLRSTSITDRLRVE